MNLSISVFCSLQCYLETRKCEKKRFHSFHRSDRHNRRLYPQRIVGAKKLDLSLENVYYEYDLVWNWVFQFFDHCSAILVSGSMPKKTLLGVFIDPIVTIDGFIEQYLSFLLNSTLLSFPYLWFYNFYSFSYSKL